jgi:hypothetical protein
MQNNTKNYNNHHGDNFLTMSLRINTENANVTMHGVLWSVISPIDLL